MSDESELEDTLENLTGEDQTPDEPKPDFVPPKTKEEFEALVKTRTDKLYARAKSAEEKLKLKEVQPPVKKDEPTSILDAKSYARLLFKGYSEEEIEQAEAVAKGSGKKVEEVMETAFFKAGLTALREQKKAEKATPPPSPAGISIGGKSFSEMDEKERKQNWSQVLSKEISAKKDRT